MNLGSRCTVFMNSSVKQAQKDGAIGGGHLRRPVHLCGAQRHLQGNPGGQRLDDLGQHIVVQGGTFLNDAVLRSFERETRAPTSPAPPSAGLMGAYGCAPHAQSMAAPGLERVRPPLAREALAAFTHQAQAPPPAGLCDQPLLA